MDRGCRRKSRWALAGDRNVDVGVIATAAVAENSFRKGVHAKPLVAAGGIR